jgi:CheY-like chemotaxis protein
MFIIDKDNLPKNKSLSAPIFIIEDEESQVLIYKSAYKRSEKSNDLVIMPRLSEMLEKLEDMQEDQVPRVIIVDLNLDNESGLHAIAAIRANSKLSECYTILATASLNPDICREAEEIGADACWEKPASLDELINFFVSI